jgi:uncharacterized membrane protein YebE (DUF533 family)
MADARELLGQLMQARTTRSTPNRIGNAFGGQGSSAGGNPLSELLGRFGLGGGSGGGSGGGNLLSDLLGGLGGTGGAAGTARDRLGDAGRAAQKNPLAVGGLAALAGAFLGGKSGVPNGALGGGALALLASLAMTSLKGRDEAQPAPSSDNPTQDAPLGLREPQTPGEEKELQDKASLIISAMINAAKADGTIDASEVQRTVGKLQTGGADPQTRQLIADEMLKPLDMDALIARARTPQLAVEVYAASLLAIEVDTPAEQDYLRRLADGLRLDPATVQRVHQTLGVTV